MTPRIQPTPLHAVPAPPLRALVLPFPDRGTRPAQSRPVPRDGLLLGRGERVFDTPFDDPAMAPQHAELRLEGGLAIVSELGSGASTRLNGVPLSEPRALADGDVLRLGDTALLFTNMDRLRGAGEDLHAAEPELTGSTPSIEAVRRSIEAVAPHSRTVVVLGETGTGKEIVARQLHRRGGRTGPFVAVNCGGFSEGLLASELFGHVRGAFTGAVAEQQGLFRAARGGTLLLDEVGEIPLSLQPTLLRVLETWQVRPVGSTRDVPLDVRVIAASNRELVGLVQRGQFRADLYARLAQWVIRLPLLRDRREDIPALVSALLLRLEEAGRPLTPDFAEALLLHPWPLNVRGLSNVLSIATIATPPGQPLELGDEVLSSMQDNRIEPEVVEPEVVEVVEPEAVVAVELDRAALEELLRRFGGRVAEMARHVGVSRPKMYRMLWAAELDPVQFRNP